MRIGREEGDAVNCQHCGTWYPPHAVPPHCAHCGAPFGPSARPAPRGVLHQPATWIAAAAVVLVLGIVLGAVLVSSNSDDKPGPSPVANGSSGPATAGPTPTSDRSPGAAPNTSPDASSSEVAAPPTRARATTRPPVTRTVTTAAPRPNGPTVPGPLSSVFGKTRVVDAGGYRSSNGNGGLYFMSPSGNIGCYVFVQDGQSAECTIAKFEFDPPDCSRAAKVTLSDDGSNPFIECSGTKPAKGPVLGYDRTVASGRIACASRESGITCADTRTGKGFTLSRERWESVH